ncbi:MAG: hypothetical protein A2637_05700 [Candidatus Muproteobacteria bacterium RIFCSPHIGHO2_01_FULL_65_16]|uniref:Carrier domain-containing protein n=1 Tax=Candidatus Muproteobacteria bacterium RIFCSPHIGHO2_01_FULL_65_16 TaxID=1817764 RepID=A0A1F6TLZ9_9PROT|nr:MAG: hypothetical protein A2637_05700 [Candidatus Muproteobacteria bacterium RIFCSPHIGHO2_01_FULL_65_16]
MDNEVQQRVLKVFCEVLERKEDEIQLDASIRSDLQLDSLKQMTLFIALEDEFQRTIPLEVVVGLDTVKDIIDFVVKKVLQEPSAA